MAEGARDRPVLEMVSSGVAAAWAGTPVSETVARRARNPTRILRIFDMLILTVSSHPVWLAYLNTRGNCTFTQVTTLHLKMRFQTVGPVLHKEFRSKVPDGT